MPGSRPLLRLQDVAVEIDGRIFFEGTNWTINRGEHWAVVGPTGAGKSLLISTICREIPLRKGSIHYYFDHDDSSRSFTHRGEIVKVTPEAEVKLRAAQQGYHQARWHSFEGANSPRVSSLLTGESIERVSSFDITPLRRPREEYARRRELVTSQLGIEGLMDRRAFQLSHGEARKVLIARALMQSPAVLILDTPLGGLDNRSRTQLSEILDQLTSQAEPSIIIVTANFLEIPPGMTHLARLEAGRIAGLIDLGSSRTGTGTPDSCISGRPVPERDRPEGNSSVVEPAAPLTGLADNPQGPDDGTIVVELRNVEVSYGRTQVLENVSWTIRQGERWALLGPNGAGKSTLLSLILADNPQAYANQVFLFGRRRGSGETIWDVKRRIGWVSPELQAHYPRSTLCRSVVESGLHDSVGLFAGTSEDRSRRTEEALTEVGVSQIAGRPFGAVSTGEQRLVLLARALVKRPELLILDEPGQGLDASNRDRLKSFLQIYCRSVPVTLIYVTHVESEIPDVVDRTLRLRRGRVLGDPDTEEIPNQ